MAQARDPNDNFLNREKPCLDGGSRPYVLVSMLASLVYSLILRALVCVLLPLEYEGALLFKRNERLELGAMLCDCVAGSVQKQGPSRL